MHMCLQLGLLTGCVMATATTKHSSLPLQPLKVDCSMMTHKSDHYMQQ
jgi:hypothetical protein